MLGLLLFGGGGRNPQHVFCSLRKLGIPPHGKKEAAGTILYSNFLCWGVFANGM